MTSTSTGDRNSRPRRRSTRAIERFTTSSRSVSFRPSSAVTGRLSLYQYPPSQPRTSPSGSARSPGAVAGSPAVGAPSVAGSAEQPARATSAATATSVSERIRRVGNQRGKGLLRRRASSARVVDVVEGVDGRRVHDDDGVVLDGDAERVSEPVRALGDAVAGGLGVDALGAVVLEELPVALRELGGLLWRVPGGLPDVGGLSVLVGGVRRVRHELVAVPALGVAVAVVVEVERLLVLGGPQR